MAWRRRCDAVVVGRQQRADPFGDDGDVGRDREAVDAVGPQPRALSGVPAKAPTRMPWRPAAATTSPQRVARPRSSSSASTVVPSARARSNGPTNSPSTPGVDRDRVDLLEGPLRLDHDEARTAAFAVCRVGAPRPPTGRERPPAPLAERWVARGAGREHGIRGAGHRRARRPRRRRRPGRRRSSGVHCGHAHDEGGAGSASARPTACTAARSSGPCWASTASQSNPLARGGAAGRRRR